jgi:hypothetical protein
MAKQSFLFKFWKKHFDYTKTLKQGVCQSHCGIASYIKKDLKAKRRIMETQIFHHAKI